MLSLVMESTSELHLLCTMLSAVTIDDDQAWSIEFYTCRNVLTHDRKVYKHEATLDVSS